MLKYVDTRVTFAEVPDEISLCINLSNCPHKCRGCHSSYLQKDTGTLLTEALLDDMITEHKGITCVCFMGGDADVSKLYHFASYIHSRFELKVAWYTGMALNPNNNRVMTKYFDFIKVGPYERDKGPLTSKTTNQIFYTKGAHMHKMDVSQEMFYDTTYKFWKETEN